jgi:hypothetical protein
MLVCESQELRHYVFMAYGHCRDVTTYLDAVQAITGLNREQLAQVNLEKLRPAPGLIAVCKRFREAAFKVSWREITRWPNLAQMRPRVLLNVLREKAIMLLDAPDDMDFLTLLNEEMGRS